MAPPTDAFGACRTRSDNETPQMRQRNFERRTKNKTELRSEPLASSTSGFYPKALSGPERPGQDPPHAPPWWPPRRCLQDLDLQGQVPGMCRQVRRAGVGCACTCVRVHGREGPLPRPGLKTVAPAPLKSVSQRPRMPPPVSGLRGLCSLYRGPRKAGRAASGHGEGGGIQEGLGVETASWGREARGFCVSPSAVPGSGSASLPCHPG